MPTVAEIHDSLREATLDAYRDEYGEYSETWRTLETKAQGNIAVAGIFIAGSLAYLTKTDLNLAQHEQVFLLAAIICLIVSVVLSIIVLRSEEVTPPPLGSFVSHFSSVLLTKTNQTELETYVVTFFNDHAKQWEQVISEIRDGNDTKALFLWRAQLLLIIAIFAVAALSLSKLVT